ncbi:MAG: ammonia channel protein [Gammaproteobacteria bacterium HGW-Gammaproteobacteria-2]|jgi:Amt family ammonium transporter|nr:MAG: ammonia channel protein [Gammaproteobacteria bacterium HGW-Gammaproteobacteria-2]
MRCPRALPRFTLPVVSLLALIAPLAQAQPQSPDSGDTAWLLVATAFVLMMIIPGLALFYGGLVRSKNILSVLMQCFAITALVSLLWVFYGYSLAFDTTGMVAGEFGLASVIGGLAKLGLIGVGRDALTGTIPESLFAAFQLTFAAITPALIVGAFAERMRFGPLLAFVTLWFTFSYLPVAHMTWAGPGGVFWDWGVLDFAGGTVVHINAGVAGLVACLVVGARRGWPHQPMPPHNLGYTVIGASLLWVGWFGFNAGSALAANGSAAMALLVTQVATAAAALAWMAIEWRLHGKASVLGIATGAVAGLVAITPAAGSAGPLGAIVIGGVSGVLCFLAAARLKRRLGYDDSLDVFGVHGVGGIVGALLTGVFADAALGGVGLAEGVSIGKQVLAQAAAISVTIVWSALVAWLSLRLIALFSPLRVDAEGETEGLDLSLHDERGYNL